MVGSISTHLGYLNRAVTSRPYRNSKKVKGPGSEVVLPATDSPKFLDHVSMETKISSISRFDILTN